MKQLVWGLMLVIGVQLLNDSFLHPVHAQSLEKINIAYSGTGTSGYVMEIAQRTGIFRRNGLDPEVVYVGSGSLLAQALIEQLDPSRCGSGFESFSVVMDLQQVTAGRAPVDNLEKAELARTAPNALKPCVVVHR